MTPGDSPRPSRRPRDHHPRQPHRRASDRTARRHVPRRHRSGDRRRPRPGPRADAADVDLAVDGGQARVSRLVAHAGRRAIADPAPPRRRARGRPRATSSAPRASTPASRCSSHARWTSRGPWRTSASSRPRSCTPASDLFPTDDRALNYTLRRPRGVAGLISPWNLPLYLFTWKIAPALATGNTVVAKPSELTPRPRPC